MAITNIVLESEKDTIEVRKALQSLADEISGAGGSTTNNITNAAREVRMILSNNSGAPNTTIDIAAGQVYAQDDESLIVNGSTIQASLSSPANNTWYRVFILGGSGVTAQGTITTSATPTLPTGYTLYRRIGWVRTDGSGNILSFRQYQQYFEHDTPITNRALANLPNTTRNLLTVTCPPNTLGTLNLMSGSTALNYGYWVRATSATDEAASTNERFDHGGIHRVTKPKQVPVDANSQVAYRGNNTGLQVGVASIGWTDLDI